MKSLTDIITNPAHNLNGIITNIKEKHILQWKLYLTFIDNQVTDIIYRHTQNKI